MFEDTNTYTTDYPDLYSLYNQIDTDDNEKLLLEFDFMGSEQ